MKKIFFLDRDDTVIEDIPYLNDSKKINFLPKMFEALKEVQKNGYEFIIVTNQSGVPRGKVDPRILSEIHEKVSLEFSRNKLNLLDINWAPFTDEHHSHWRKPGSGMLSFYKHRYQIDFKSSWVVGDRGTDVLAGKAMGCKTILIQKNMDRFKESNFESKPDFVIQDWAEFLVKILKDENLKDSL